MNFDRYEWRGDLFASDLPVLLQKFHTELSLIEREWLDTFTVYFDNYEEVHETRRTARLRSYGEIPAEGVTLSYLKKLRWQLEVKSDKAKNRVIYFEGLPTKISSGLYAESGDSFTDTQLLPQILRVTRRRHYSYGERIEESERITVDVQRLNYFFDTNEHLIFLGDLGPRVEIKSKTQKELTSLIRKYSLDEIAWVLKHRSQHLYFQHCLRSVLSKESYEGFPEVELKYSLSSASHKELLKTILDWVSSQDDMALLLPRPAYVVRLLKNHIVYDPITGKEYTHVEFPSGKVSIKHKQRPRVQDELILLRDTQGDLMGEVNNTPSFVKDGAYLNSYIKIQRKIPFALANGHAYHIAIDYCVDKYKRELEQVEIEFIGSIGERPESLEAITGDMLQIHSRMMEIPAFASELHPTTESKFSFFSKK